MENFNDRMLDVVNLVSKTDKYTTMTKVRTEPVLATVIQLMRQSAVEYGGFTEERAEAEVEAWIAAPGVKFGLETTRSRVDAGSLFSPDVEIKHFEEPREEMLPKFENAMKCWQNCQHMCMMWHEALSAFCKRDAPSLFTAASWSARRSCPSPPTSPSTRLTRRPTIMPMNQSLLNPKNHTILALHLKRMGGWVRDQVVYVDPTYQQVDMASPVSFRIFTHSELMATGHYALEDSTGRREMFCNWKQVLQRLAQQVSAHRRRPSFSPLRRASPGALGRGHGGFADECHARGHDGCPPGAGGRAVRACVRGMLRVHKKCKLGSKGAVVFHMRCKSCKCFL